MNYFPEELYDQKCFLSVSHASHLEKSTKACVHEYLEAEYGSGDDPKTSKSSAKQSRAFQNDKNTVPLRVQCVEGICAVITEEFPDLWRLGQSYFTGQLHSVVDVDKQGQFKVCLKFEYRNLIIY